MTETLGEPVHALGLGERKHHGTREKVIRPVKVSLWNTGQGSLQNIDQFMNIRVEESMDDLAAPRCVVDLRDQCEIAFPSAVAFLREIAHRMNEGTHVAFNRHS